MGLSGETEATILAIISSAPDSEPGQRGRCLIPTWGHRDLSPGPQPEIDTEFLRDHQYVNGHRNVT